MNTEVEVNLHVRLVSTEQEFQHDAVGLRYAHVGFHVECGGEAERPRGLFGCCRTRQIRFEVGLRLREIVDRVLVEFRCRVSIVAQLLNVSEVGMRHVRRRTEIGERKESVAVANFIAQKVVGVLAEMERRDTFDFRRVSAGDKD